MTDKKEPPEDQGEDRLEIEDLAPKTDESTGPTGGYCGSYCGQCHSCSGFDKKSPKL
jgi:hypothetical protein